jgi:CRP/FNR family transcriptional regulator, nitrogen fixation regulation protein
VGRILLEFLALSFGTGDRKSNVASTETLRLFGTSSNYGIPPMFVRLTTNVTSSPTSLVDFGMTSESNPIVSLNEFTYKKGAEIFGEKEPAEYVYQVRTGAVRSYKLLTDGRRQIGSFHLAGDIFGLENGDVHRFTADALVKTTVRLIKRLSLETVAKIDAVVSRNLLGMTTVNLMHAEDHMLLLGRKNSMEKVAAFLLEMDKRSTANGIVALPMSRRDIADYLGLTLETVSRAISRFHRAGLLHFMGSNQREISLLDRVGLESFNLPA